MKKTILVLITLAVIAFGWYRYALRPADAADTAAYPVMIPQGLSVRGIAKVLHEKNFLRSPLAFEIYARVHGIAGSLQAGTFSMKTSMTVPELVAVMQRGLTEQVTVTIPEGFTVQDIDALLAAKGLTETGALVTCALRCDFSAYDFLPSGPALAARGGRLEGYLFPDTYFLSRSNFTVEDVIDRLLENFQKRVIVGLADDLRASDRSVQEIVTMASLIEEETRTADERPVVSGILWKRLDGGISLGVDAAVRYIIGKPTAAITKADLEIDSPYNLRKYRDLPPGPIASPGLSSIKAALEPKASPYLFYLHGTDGVIRYAQTNDEHNANRARYLR